MKVNQLILSSLFLILACSNNNYTQEDLVFVPDAEFEQLLIEQNIDSDQTLNGTILRSDAEKVYRLDLNKDYFKGHSRDKIKIYKSFNWFCLPSNGEGLSKAAIEASSFGIPLILSNVEGNRDMINNNGYFFEYSDRAVLKDVLCKVTQLNQEDYVNLSKASYKMFNDNWTMDSIYEKWMSILN